jgi:pimeloyl-ACP methyl ester carboxylesterase
MGNSRGNLYSLGHVTLNPSEKEFWEFSWDEMAHYDLPANVEYVLNFTGHSNLSYVGHSQGTLQMFALLSTTPAFVSRFNSYVGLGPVATVAHITNDLLLLLAKFDVDRLFELLGFNQFLPSEAWLNRLFPYVCREDAGLCDSIIEFICGPHKGAFNNTRMQVVAAHEPGGTSVQNVAHFAQCIRSGLFQAYDWGSAAQNQQHYNSTTPPIYDISVFPIQQLPTSLYYGTLDELADPTDVAWLLGHLSSPPYYTQELDNYAHLDFVWDIDAYYQFYPQIVDLIRKTTGNHFSESAN